jgi:hypothetical protein
MVGSYLLFDFSCPKVSYGFKGTMQFFERNAPTLDYSFCIFHNAAVIKGQTIYGFVRGKYVIFQGTIL